MSNKKVKLSKDQVLHVSKLANLKLTDKEVKKFQKQLSQILDYMEMLNEVETTDISPTSQVTGLNNIFREDNLGKCLKQKDALKNTKSKENGYFKIKSIFE